MIKANDFTKLIQMLGNANRKYNINNIDGEHPCITCPSEHPECYSAGVCFSFNDDGSLYAVHAYEPDEGEE